MRTQASQAEEQAAHAETALAQCRRELASSPTTAGISQRLAVLSHDQFQINPGSLFPSLYRLEQDGKLKAEWRPTENNRRAKYYRLTASGRKQLEQHRERWNRVSVAVASVLEGA